MYPYPDPCPSSRHRRHRRSWPNHRRPGLLWSPPSDLFSTQATTVPFLNWASVRATSASELSSIFPCHSVHKPKVSHCPWSLLLLLPQPGPACSSWDTNMQASWNLRSSSVENMFLFCFVFINSSLAPSLSSTRSQHERISTRRSSLEAQNYFASWPIWPFSVLFTSLCFLPEPYWLMSVLFIYSSIQNILFYYWLNNLVNVTPYPIYFCNFYYIFSLLILYMCIMNSGDSCHSSISDILPSPTHFPLPYEFLSHILVFLFVLWHIEFA